MYPILAAILAVLSLALPAKHVAPQLVQIAYAESIPAQMPTAPTIADLIDQAATTAGVATTTARAVAWCESHYHQFNTKGNDVLRGPDGHDVGVMQIRETVHADEASARGQDIYSIAGNLAYGMQLMASEGTTPWLSSKYCWAPLLKNPALIPK